MELYNFDSHADDDYRNVLFHQYGGSDKMYSDRYVWNSQEGDGFGSIFSSLGSLAMPIIKSIGKTISKAFIPMVKTLGREAIKGGAEYALGKTVEGVVNKRKRRKTTHKSKRSRHV